MDNKVEELVTFLKQPPREIKVATLPDFFLDRLISFECGSEDFSKALENITKRKGGSIDGVSQVNQQGGNAVNVALALAMLGVKVAPIVCTSRQGMELLRFYLEPRGVDLSHVKILKKASITTALEFRSGKEKVNVMVRDVGSLANFNSGNLADDDWSLLENADWVCMFNWAGTRNHGTELTRNVFQRAKAKSRGKTYLDTADPTPNREEIPEFVRKVLKSDSVDVLSLNENEAVTYASFVGGDDVVGPRDESLEKLALDSARLLARQLSARIDLHTTRFSATFTKDDETLVPSFKVKMLRATGAGDSWDAGNILGDAMGLSAESRLMLANAVAACYISSLDGSHPTREQLIRFLGKHSF